MIKINPLLYITFIACTLISCSKSEGPEKVLRSFEQELSRGRVSENNLGQWFSDEASENFSINKKINKMRLKKLTIIHSNCANDTCSYTYDVSYAVLKNQSQATMDVRKQAVLRFYDKNSWRIDDIDIIKSYIENKIPIKI